MIKRFSIVILSAIILSISSVNVLFGEPVRNYESEGDNLLSEIDEHMSALLRAVVSVSSNEEALEKVRSHYADHGIMIPEDRMQEVVDYIKSVGIDGSNGKKEEVDYPEYFDNLTIYDKEYDSETDLEFPIYACVQDVCRNLDYITQINNPELFSFDPVMQSIGSIHLYLSSYEDIDKLEAQQKFEDYSNQIASAIEYSFPLIDFDVCYVNWNVPSINEDSLYAASYRFEYDGSSFNMESSNGDIYQ
jgi:hypothetical protein